VVRRVSILDFGFWIAEKGGDEVRRSEARCDGLTSMSALWALDEFFVRVL
jgi:hypothetical protein